MIPYDEPNPLNRLETSLVNRRDVARAQRFTAMADDYAKQLAALQTLRWVGRLQSISTAPRDGTWVLLFGPSGYTTTPFRAEVGRYYPSYRPLNPWRNHANNAFADGGPEPTHWMPLSTAP